MSVFGGSVHHLSGLIASSEYVLRVKCAGESYQFPSTSPYLGLFTKTSRPSVTISYPAENQSVSGTVDVIATAYDSQPGQSDNGISKMELDVDDQTLNPSGHTTDTHEYTFTLDTTQLANGYHVITVHASDDYGNSARYSRTICVGNEAGMSGATRTTTVQQRSPLSWILVPQEACLASLRLLNKAYSVHMTPPKPEPVMISTNRKLEAGNARWPGDCQKRANRDGAVIITVSGAVGHQRIRLWVHDPADKSPYRLDRHSGDNLALPLQSHYVGGCIGLFSAPGYRCTVVPDDPRPMYEVKADKNGVAKVVLRLSPDVASGDNFYVQAKDPDTAHSLGRGANIVAWKRIYLEVDHMAVGRDIISDVGANASSVLLPRQINGLFNTSDRADVTVRDDDHPQGETARIVSLVEQQAGTLVTLDRQLASSYEVDRHSALQLNGATYGATMDWVGNVHGSVNRNLAGRAIETSDGGCYVDVVKLPSGPAEKTIMPHRDALQEPDMNDFSQRYFDHKGEASVVHVGCIAYGQRNGKAKEGLQGYSDPNEMWTWICLHQIMVNNYDSYLHDPVVAQEASMVLAHEIGHQLGIRRDETLWPSALNADDRHSRNLSWIGGPCIMDTSDAHGFIFDSLATQDCELCTPHALLERTRGCH